MPNIKMRAKLSVPLIKNLKPESKQYVVRDTVLTGFGVRVSPGGRKAFFYEYRIHGRNRAVTLGSFGKLTLEQAKRIAKQHAGNVSGGIDPAEIKRAAERKAQRSTYTLRHAFDAYINAPVSKGKGKGQPKKPRTIKDIEKQQRKFDDWMELPVGEITRSMIEARYKKLEIDSVVQANLAMRYLRAVFNRVIKNSGDDNEPLLSHNPVGKLTDTDSWRAVERRKSYISAHLMPVWFETVITGLQMLKHGDLQRDILITMLLTGCRPSEAYSLQWNGIDFEIDTITFKNTKNRADHVLPIPRYLRKLLLNRKVMSGDKYVFSNSDGVRLYDIRTAKRIIQDNGILFMPTDLRRTFITKAESLGLSTYSLKTLLNHTQGDDVTGGYVQIEVERLREPMQRIEDALLRDAKMLEADVIDINRGALA